MAAATLPHDVMIAIVTDITTIAKHGWLSDSELALLLKEHPEALAYVNFYIEATVIALHPTTEEA